MVGVWQIGGCGRPDLAGQAETAAIDMIRIARVS